MTTHDDKKNLLMRGQEFLQLYRKVEGFTQELMKENERLRYRVAALEQEHAVAPKVPVEEVQNLKGRVEQLEAEREALVQRYKQVEQENLDALYAIESEGRLELQKVVHALARMDRGEYAVCSRCGGPIGTGRLAALPHADTCIGCAD